MSIDRSPDASNIKPYLTRHHYYIPASTAKMTKRTALKQASLEPKRRQRSLGSNRARMSQRRRRDSIDLNTPDEEFVPTEKQDSGPNSTKSAKSPKRLIMPATRARTKKLELTGANGTQDAVKQAKNIPLNSDDIKQGNIISIFHGEENNANVKQKPKTAK